MGFSPALWSGILGAIIVQTLGDVKIFSVDQQKSEKSTVQDDLFEAAFQGECREDAPCQQLCFDLHDGTFECGCKEGYTLVADGYSCIENSEYEMLRNMNLTLPEDDKTDEPKHHIFRYISRGPESKTRDNRSYRNGRESLDPRARTLSQSENSWYAIDPLQQPGSNPDNTNQELYKPEISFPRDEDIFFKTPDRRHRRRPSTPSTWLANEDSDDASVGMSSTFPTSDDTSSDVFEPVNTVTMTTVPSTHHYAGMATCEELKCEHGGVCVPSSDNERYRCRCPVGWTGKLCEKVEMIRYPRFKSHSYLALRMVKDTGRSLRMELEFRPELYEGVLLYLGNPQDPGDNEVFGALALKNGILEFRYYGGIRVGVIRSEQPVTLNSWNRATVFVDTRKVWLQLNEGPRPAKQSKGVFPGIAAMAIVYLGGFSNMSRLAHATDSAVGFRGCVRHLAINSYFYTFRSSTWEDIVDGADLEECRPGVCNTVSCMNGGQCAAVKPNWGTCLCPLGFGGDHCGNAVEVIVPSFDGTAHLQFPGLASSSLTFTEILLVFLPRAANGALLYNGYRINGTGDFLSLSLVSGHVQMRFDLGTGVNTIRSRKPVSMHEWHKVLVTRTGRLGVLQVDEDPPQRHLSPGGYSQLSLPLNLYLGGVPSLKELATAAEVNNSFIGCVQRLVINGKAVKLVEQALSGVNINNCEHPCVQKPCEHGGSCSPTLDTYTCRCSAGYTGPNCRTEIVDMVTRPMFIGNSYLHYVNEVIISRLRGQSLHLSLSFRALAPFGLILWAGSREVDSSSDYLALGLHNGHLHLDYNLGSGPVSLHCNHTRVDDGFWHELNVVRFKQRGSMTVDNRHTVTGVSPGPLKELNIQNELFLGGMPDISHRNVGAYYTGLVGCLSSFTVDRDYHIQFLTMAITGINIQPCV